MLSLVAEKFTYVHEKALSLLFPAKPLGLVQKFLLPLQRIDGVFSSCRNCRSGEGRLRFRSVETMKHWK